MYIQTGINEHAGGDFNIPLYGRFKPKKSHISKVNIWPVALKGTSTNILLKIFRLYKISLAVIWLVSLVIDIPWVFVCDIRESGGCLADFKDSLHNVYYNLMTFGFGYMFPLFCIVTCYAIIWRMVSKRKTFSQNNEPSNKRTTIEKTNSVVRTRVSIIIILFAVSWAPLVIFRLLSTAYPEMMRMKGCPAVHFILIFFGRLIFHWILFIFSFQELHISVYLVVRKWIHLLLRH